MLQSSRFKRIYIACGYTDLRYGIDGLAATVRERFNLNPFETDILFLFCGRRNDRIKALVWEGDGFLLLYKRLEDGKFKWPRKTEDLEEISEEQFRWLLTGLDVNPGIRKVVPAERAIRPFCVGKKNWKLIDTIHGAEASAIIYSIVETCKLNNLNIFYYISHLLTEIPKHMDDTNLDFLEDLLPWSEKLPKEANQDILALEVKKKLEQYPTILLAGHFCIFNKLNCVEELPPSVFEKISLERILLLEADPEQILANLSVRDKKKYEYRQIERLIREERRVAEEISQKCNCDLHIHQMTFDDSDLKKCCDLLSSEVQTV